MQIKVQQVGSLVRVQVSPTYVERFNRSFSCSGIQDTARFTFEFDGHGDLVDIRTNRKYQDGAGMVALVDDALMAALVKVPHWAYGQLIHTCIRMGIPDPVKNSFGWYTFLGQTYLTSEDCLRAMLADYIVNRKPCPIVARRVGK